MQLEEFGCNVSELKKLVKTRVFCAWLEEWEIPLLKYNICVVEARLLENYKGLVFEDPDKNTTFTIYEGNLEYHRGKGGGWYLIGVSADDSVEDEPFEIGDMVIELI